MILQIELNNMTTEGLLKKFYITGSDILNIHYEKPICIPIYHNQQAGKLFRLGTSTMTFQIDATYETSLA